MPAAASPGESYTVEGVAGAPVCLPLGIAAATGFSWQLDLPPGVTRLEDVTDPAQQHSVYQAGSGPASQVCVQAAAGDYEITAKLLRPWDKDDAIRVLKIRLKIKAG